MNSSSTPPRRSRFKDKMTASEKIFFGLACALAAFFTAIIQTCFFFNFRPFGFAPDLCLALAAVAGIKFGAKCGGIVGLLAGFFLDAFSANGISLAIPFYLMLGVIMGLLTAEGSNVSLSPFLLFLIGVGVGATVSGIAATASICMSYASFNIADVIFKTVLPEIVSTLVFSLIIYPPALLVARLVKDKV